MRHESMGSNAVKTLITEAFQIEPGLMSFPKCGKTKRTGSSLYKRINKTKKDCIKLQPNVDIYTLLAFKAYKPKTLNYLQCLINLKLA